MGGPQFGQVRHFEGGEYFGAAGPATPVRAIDPYAVDSQPVGGRDVVKQALTDVEPITVFDARALLRKVEVARVGLVASCLLRSDHGIEGYTQICC